MTEVTAMDTTILIFIVLQTIIFALTLTAIFWQIGILKNQLKDQIYMDIASKVNGLYEKVLEYPEALGPFVFGSVKFSDKNSLKDYYLKKGYQLSLFNLFHWVFLQHDRGNVSPDSWRRWESLFKAFLSRSEIVAFWNELEARDQRYNADFVVKVGELIKEADGGGLI